MKKIMLLTAAILAATLAGARDPRLEEEKNILRDKIEYAFGANCLMEFDIEPYAPAPKGYEAYYIYQYSRHGSRYAWSPVTYVDIAQILNVQHEAGNLTEFGENFRERFLPFGEKCAPYVGEITKKGWDQQQKVAKQLVESEPKFFRKNPYIETSSTFAPRAIMSEAAFCTGLKAVNPKLDIFEKLSQTEIVNVAPGDLVGAEDRAKLPHLQNEWECGVQEFYDSHINYDEILSRLFKTPQDSYNGWSRKKTVFELWRMAIGTVSLDFEADFLDLFTTDELIAMEQCDCFEVYSSTEKDVYAYTPAADRIVEEAEQFLIESRPQVRLRFGHDSILNRLFLLFGVGPFAQTPSTPEATLYTMPQRLIPMACNLRFVFYRKNGAEPLVRVLLNGENTTLPLTPVCDGFYRFEDFKAYIAALPRP